MTLLFQTSSFSAIRVRSLLFTQLSLLATTVAVGLLSTTTVTASIWALFVVVVLPCTARLLTGWTLLLLLSFPQSIADKPLSSISVDTNSSCEKEREIEQSNSSIVDTLGLGTALIGGVLIYPLN